MEPTPRTALEDLYKSIQTFGSIQMNAESRDKLYRYNNALMESIHSILEDGDCDEAVKLETFNTTMEQYAAAMRELFPKLLSGQQPARDQKTAVGKSDPGRFVSIVEVEKFNPYHDSKGRFASANSAASFTYSPGKSNAHDKAIARERERQAAAATPAAASGPKAMDLDEYLGTKGLASDVDDFMLDKLRNPHGMTQRQQAKLQRDAKASSDDYHARRQAAIDEYNRKVESGELRPKTKVERLLQTAQGHDDNPSVQAARRLLDKRGIDWKTGETKKSVEKADIDAIVRIEEVEKFNPYHDERGRFATADGYSSFTIRTKDPGKQHMADLAIAREKERAGAASGGAAPAKQPEKAPEKPQEKPKETPANDNMTITATGKSTLPESVLSKCQEVEAKTVSRKTEKMTVVDSDGNIILEKSGGKGSVSFGAREGFYMNDKTTVTHNHPGEYGGTFSGADVKVLVDYKLKAIRAVGKEGTYSLERADTNSNKSYDFKQEYAKHSNATNSKMRTEYKSLTNKVAQGKTSVSDANKQLSDYRTSLCNEQHEWLVQNAAKYGFNYVFVPSGGVGKMFDEIEKEEAEETTGAVVLDGEFMNGDNWMIGGGESDD